MTFEKFVFHVQVPEARLQAQEREWKRLLARPFSDLAKWGV